MAGLHHPPLRLESQAGHLAACLDDSCAGYGARSGCGLLACPPRKQHWQPTACWLPYKHRQGVHPLKLWHALSLNTHLYGAFGDIRTHMPCRPAVSFSFDHLFMSPGGHTEGFPTHLSYHSCTVAYSSPVVLTYVRNAKQSRILHLQAPLLPSGQPPSHEHPQLLTKGMKVLGQAFPLTPAPALFCVLFGAGAHVLMFAVGLLVLFACGCLTPELRGAILRDCFCPLPIPLFVCR